MQAITFVLAVAVLHAVAAHVINRDIEKFDKEYFAECQEEFHVTDFPKRDTDDNPENYKCFLRCLGLKSGVLRDNGDIDEQLMEQKFTKDHPEMLTEVKERIPNCKVMLKDSSCGAFSDFLQCLVKDLNEHK